MPYIPTNCWPHNCAVERSSDGYHFLGTVDKYDYIEDVHLRIYDENNQPRFIAKNKDNIIVDLQDEDFSQELISITKPPYDLQNKVIDLKVQPVLEEGIDNTEVTIVMNIKDVIMDAYISGSNYGKPTDGLRLGFHLPYTLRFSDGEIINGKIYYYFYRNRSFESYQQGAYWPKNEIIPPTSTSLKTTHGELGSANDFKATLTSLEYLYDISGFIPSFHIALSFFKLPLTYVKNGKSYQFAISFTGFFKTPSVEVYYKMFAQKGGYFYTFSGQYLSVSNKKIDYLNSSVKQEKKGFYDYFSNSMTWDFKLISNKYDNFVMDGVGEIIDGKYLKIPSIENLEDGQKLNNKYYIKIEENTNYFYKIGIAQLKKTNTSSPFSYTLTFYNDEDIEELLNLYGTKFLYLTLGTSSFEIEQLQSFSVSNNIITFTNKIDLLGTSITQMDVVYSFLRDTSLISLHANSNNLTDDNLIIPTTNDTNFFIYSNNIISPNYSFNIEPQFNFYPEISNIDKSYIISETNSLLKWFQVKIFCDDILIHTSKKIYLPHLYYEYLSLKDKKYTSKILLETENSLIKEFAVVNDFILNYDSQNYDFAKYHLLSKSNVLWLSNILSLPWIDSNENLWINDKQIQWEDTTELFSLEDNIILNLEATIYRYLLGSNNEIKEQLLLADRLNLEPTWTENNSNFTFDHLFYDYGINNENKYQYEVFYNADILVPKEYNINFGDEKVNFKYYCLNNQITSWLLSNENVLFNKENNTLEYNGIVYNITFFEDLSIQSIVYQVQNGVDEEGNPIYENIELNTEPINESDVQRKTVAIVKSNIISTNDWIGVCLYGTKYNFDENDKNRYELDDNQVWYFDLDTKADTIDYNNERNIFTNASTLPKVGSSNLNYMSQSITTKLGYLNEEDIYVEDNGQKLNKFSEFANDGSVKLLRLRNGYLIPVDIALKNRTTNYSVSETPGDINFSWTQIGEHKDSVLYSLVKGAGFKTLQEKGEI